MKRLYSTAFCLEIQNVLKKSINPVYSVSCACQNPSEIQVEKVDTAQPSRRPEKPDRHLVDNPRSQSRTASRRVTKGYEKKNSQVSPVAPKQLHKWRDGSNTLILKSRSMRWIPFS